ncbi:hypothetical protein VTH06DRAFT_642 [Thermothelomyces fergusii]
MKSASRLFYLSVFALWGPQAWCQNSGSASSSFSSSSSSQDDCAISPKAIVSDACASYATLERLNREVKPALDELTRTTDFFSHYRVNLFHKKCPFWNDENGMCGNIACAVETLDNEEDIPPVWRASELGKLEGPRAKHPGKSMQREEPARPLRGGLGEDVGETCVVEYDDECDERDYCVPEDERAGSKGDYVSLLRNPERFTGYAGDGARQVWDAIYRENCFQRSSFPRSAALGRDDTSPRPGGPAAMDFKAVLEAAGRQQALAELRQHNPRTPFAAKTGYEHEDECLEKRVFYRVISGMHASISTHLCWDFLNQTTGRWQPNLGCYLGRLHAHPDRISNLYFNYALLTRAVAKLGPHLARPGDYTFCLGDPDQDAATRAKVMAVAERAASVPQTLDESLMFRDGEGPSLKEDFRNRFRNVSRLMDCVGCDKCRLWGKLQTAGYGTALKVLFEFDNNNNDNDPAPAAPDPAPSVPVLKRTELVALFNTYARLSNSLEAVQKFRKMVRQLPVEAEAEAEAEPADKSEEDDDDDENDPPAYENRTLKEEFDDELDMMLRTLRFVLVRWITFPATLWHIATCELRRLWQSFIGLPVSPRTWTFEAPRVDEL